MIKTKTLALTASQVIEMRNACFASISKTLKDGMQNPRIVRMLNEDARGSKTAVCVDLKTAEFLVSKGVTREQLAQIFGEKVNPTKPLRFGQFAQALRAGSLAHIDAGSARGLVGLREAHKHSLHTDALIDVVMGKQAPKGLDCSNLRGVSLARINKLVGRNVGAGTAPAFVSRSFGRGGFFEMLGDITVKGSRGAEVTLSEAPGALVRSFFDLIDGVSDKELATLGAAVTKGEE